MLPTDFCDDDSYFTQGLNVFQRLALVSQFFTVFGSIMFVMQEAVAQTSGKAEDANGKLLVIYCRSIAARESVVVRSCLSFEHVDCFGSSLTSSSRFLLLQVAFMIMFVNAAAGGMYPLWKFFDSWCIASLQHDRFMHADASSVFRAESEEIDWSFIKSNLFKAFTYCLGTKAADGILNSFSCLVSAKQRAEEMQDEAKQAAASMRSTDEALKAQETYNQAKSAKERAQEVKRQADEARQLQQDVVQSTKDTKAAAADLKTTALGKDKNGGGDELLTAAERSLPDEPSEVPSNGCRKSVSTADLVFCPETPLSNSATDFRANSARMSAPVPPSPTGLSVLSDTNHMPVYISASVTSDAEPQRSPIGPAVVQPFRGRIRREV